MDTTLSGWRGFHVFFPIWFLVSSAASGFFTAGVKIPSVARSITSLWWLSALLGPQTNWNVCSTILVVSIGWFQTSTWEMVVSFNIHVPFNIHSNACKIYSLLFHLFGISAIRTCSFKTWIFFLVQFILCGCVLCFFPRWFVHFFFGGGQQFLVPEVAPIKFQTWRQQTWVTFGC